MQNSNYGRTPEKNTEEFFILTLNPLDFLECTCSESYRQLTLVTDKYSNWIRFVKAGTKCNCVTHWADHWAIHTCKHLTLWIH